MATWGDFIKDVTVHRINKKMYASIDEAIDLWEDRRKLRERVTELEAELTSAREQAAQEVEEFARVCGNEGMADEATIQLLQAAAGMIRTSGQEIIEAQPVEEPEPFQNLSEVAPISQAEPIYGEAPALPEAEALEPSMAAEPVLEAEPVAEAEPVEETPHAEVIPEAEPVPEEETR